MHSEERYCKSFKYIAQDVSTEQAIKYMFVPSITAQTAISCITEEKEKELHLSQVDEIKCLLRAIKSFGDCNSSLSKILFLFFKNLICFLF